MIYPEIDQEPRHPSQLYEAFFEGLLIFIILILYFKKNNKNLKIGKISAIFLILYSVFRFSIEFLREPDIQIGLIFNYFSMGQILSLPLLALGIIIFSKKWN